MVMAMIEPDFLVRRVPAAVLPASPAGIRNGPPLTR